MGPVRIGGGRWAALGSGEGGGDMKAGEAGDGLPGVPVPDPDTTSG